MTEVNSESHKGHVYFGVQVALFVAVWGGLLASVLMGD